MKIPVAGQACQKLWRRCDRQLHLRRVQAVKQMNDVLPNAARRRADDMQDAHRLLGRS